MEYLLKPETIKKNISSALQEISNQDYIDVNKEISIAIPPKKLKNIIADLEKKMLIAAENLEFEEAARLRDEIAKLQKNDLGLNNNLRGKKWKKI